MIRSDEIKMLLTSQKSGVLTCIVLFWFQYIGIVCFLYGFLPMKNPVGGYASPADYEGFFNHTRDIDKAQDKSNLNKPKRFVGQLVFMVIDALRADFVFSIKNINQAGIKFKKTDDEAGKGING